jgi:hypothetical protein
MVAEAVERLTARSSPRRGAIHLCPAGKTLAVAEGIETPLAMRLATQASRLPGRSAVKTGGMFP